jgi:predicted aspartyl protease
VAEATGAGSQSADAKWIALRNYRRARGQCYTCGERYSREHQCKGTVQLHVLQEVLELFSIEAVDHDQASSSGTQAELHLMVKETTIKDPSTLTFKLTGVIQDQQIQFLVDSGSTHSFLNNTFIPQLSGVVPMQATMRVKVANGEQLQCNQTLLDCPWTCEGHQFSYA